MAAKRSQLLRGGFLEELFWRAEQGEGEEG
jgi:hypothetical protein